MRKLIKTKCYDTMLIDGQGNITKEGRAGKVRTAEGKPRVVTLPNTPLESLLTRLEMKRPARTMLSGSYEEGYAAAMRSALREIKKEIAKEDKRIVYNVDGG